MTFHAARTALNSGLLTFCIVLLVLLYNSPGYTTVFDPGAFGVRPEGMGGAVVGLPNDTISAFYYNPAGIAELKGTHVTSGIFRLKMPAEYDGARYKEENSDTPVLPYIALVTDAVAPVGLGISVLSTLGTGFSYKDFPLGNRYIDIKSSAGLLSINPTFAYEVNPRLSLGVEINIGYCISEMKMPLLTPAAQGYLKTDADGFGLGVLLGLLFKISPSLNFGMSWRSPMKTGLKGDFHLEGLNGDMDVDYYWPQMLLAGIGYYVTPDLALGLCVKWSDWSDFNKSEFKYESFLPDTPVTTGAEDTWRFQVGMEYFVVKSLALRCGYIYDPAAIKKETISPMLPDMDIHEIFAGIGLRIGKFFLELGTNYGMWSETRVSNSTTGFEGKYSGYRYGTGIEMTYCW
ncbi:MAG: outer membrane protein transport protein [Thermodesulfobacteriota bacterium]|nr:outer membrane protein transport protein [Thermodesulfobacteriota bacterium]